MQTTAPRVFLRGQTSASECIFSGRDLTKVYVNGECEVRALDGVDIELYESELVVLLGASGSGKSTLLNTLGGLDVPTSGALTYCGRDLATADEDQLTTFRRHEVGFVFQSYNLIPSLTARENVALTTELAVDPMTPEEALELVELGERMDFFPSQLSGGQQQRVAIARAIAKRPRVLFCDEPTGALDTRTGVTVLEAIERVNRDLGTLVVIITHNAVLGEMADRVMHFASGRISAVERNRRRCPVSLVEW
ncbi:MAG TPA: ABC transporter ATP-binding protein [Terrimicrobiaceae bacterium]|nr:ABC transporter ATP-binding protein [Terrimicrobiaceae bacterium]